MWIILDINYKHYYHLGKSQICAGAGDYFRTSKPHSVKLCAASHISFSLLSLYLFSACLQQSTGGWRLQCWENFVMGSAFMWPLVCRPSCTLGTVRKPGSGWDTSGKLFLLSAMTHKRKYHFKHLISSNSQPELELSMRLREISQCQSAKIITERWMDLC